MPSNISAFDLQLQVRNLWSGLKALLGERAQGFLQCLHTATTGTAANGPDSSQSEMLLGLDQNALDFHPSAVEAIWEQASSAAALAGRETAHPLCWMKNHNEGSPDTGHRQSHKQHYLEELCSKNSCLIAPWLLLQSWHESQEPHKTTIRFTFCHCL